MQWQTSPGLCRSCEILRFVVEASGKLERKLSGFNSSPHKCFGQHGKSCSPPHAVRFLPHSPLDFAFSSLQNIVTYGDSFAMLRRSDDYRAEFQKSSAISDTFTADELQRTRYIRQTRTTQIFPRYKWLPLTTV